MASSTESGLANVAMKSTGAVTRAVYENVSVSRVTDDGLLPTQGSSRSGIRVEIVGGQQNGFIKMSKGTQLAEQLSMNRNIETVKVGGKAILVSSNESSYIFCFSSVKDMKSFETTVKSVGSSTDLSVFTQRTEEASAEQYFQFYGYLSQQQNMMQDYIRTSTYQRAMLDNMADFQNKIILDVGAGSGILSFFAIQAGAKKVYAVEASSMAQQCETLVKNNGLEDRIVVIPGKIEEVDVPEQVDVIISEPMGYMLFNERMLETYLHAKKWLKPKGKMFPTQGDLHIAPFTDEALYMEQCSKANFWYQDSFHSVDLSSLRDAAVLEYFRQPIVDTFDIQICLARSHKYTVDFLTAHESDLFNIDIPLSFMIAQAGTIHGLAFWFDVAFLGSQSTVWLSTAPTQPLTHWYQVRCLLQTPVFVKQGQQVVGRVLLKCNKRQSYDVELSLSVPGTTIKSSNILDLKNPLFRYTGHAPQPQQAAAAAGASGEVTWNTNDVTMQVVNADDITVGTAAGTDGASDVFNVALLNGPVEDGAQGILQQVAVIGESSTSSDITCDNLPSLGNIPPVHPGSIPSPGTSSVNSPQHLISALSPANNAAVSNVIVVQTPGASGAQGILDGQYLIGDFIVSGAGGVIPISAENLQRLIQ